MSALQQVELESLQRDRSLQEYLKALQAQFGSLSEQVLRLAQEVDRVAKILSSHGINE